MSDIKPESFYYLASPYSDTSESIRYDRFVKVTKIGYKLTQLGLNLFCPITQSHVLEDHGFDEFRAADGCLKLTHEEWMRVDYAFLSRAEGLIVVMLDGWKESKGVALEIEYAIQHKIGIYMLSPGSDLKTFVDYVMEPEPIPGKYRTTKEKNVNETITLGQVPIRGQALDTTYLFGPSDTTNVTLENDRIIPGVKDSSGKDALRFVPYAALQAIARVREHGNQKYKDPAKWYEFDAAKEQFIEAAQRHLAKYQDATLYKNRSVYDEESGLHHLDHAITTLALAIALRDKPSLRGDK